MESFIENSCDGGKTMDLSGKVVVLTGASRGIGRALALELAKSGCNLLLTALEGDELALLSDQIKKNLRIPIDSMAGDLSNGEKRRGLIHWINAHQKLPDILINNAGIGYFGRFEGLDWRQIERTLALNIAALVHLTFELIPVLKTKPHAKIVNVSSGMSRLPYPGLAIYGATKAFVSSFSASLAAELEGTSINVLCFHPGFTRTSFIGSAGMDTSKVPRLWIHSPEKVAVRLRRAIQKDKHWEYSDILTRFLALLGEALPMHLKTSIFKGLFWRLPDAR